MTEAMTGQSSNAQLHATGVDVKVTVNFDAKTLCIELAGASNESNPPESRKRPAPSTARTSAAQRRQVIRNYAAGVLSHMLA